MRYESPLTEVTMIAMNAILMVSGPKATIRNFSLPLSEREFYLPENWENWI